MAPYVPHLEGPQPYSLNASSLANLKAECSGGKKLKLHELVKSTCNFSATDPKDRIFALVGLSCDTKPHFIDYKLEPRDIHVRLAVNALTYSEESDRCCLDFLSNARRGPFEKDYPDLPSWVPNLIHYDVAEGEAWSPLASIFPTGNPPADLQPFLFFGPEEVRPPFLYQVSQS